MELKIRLSDANIHLLESVADITGYETNIEEDGWIDVDYILSAMDELQDKYSDLKDSYEEYREFVKDNYKQKTLEETYR